MLKRSRLLMLLFVLLAAAPQRDAFSFLRPVQVEQGEDSPESTQSGQQAQQASAQRPPEESDRFYDTNNPDYRTLQKADDVRDRLPADKRGAIDWMGALRGGAINPRADVDGSSRQQVLDLDIILKNTKEMPFVKFPHNSHTEWLACSNCHDKLFMPKAGANAMSMEKIFRGEFCGACHGRVAFITHFSCERCHSVPQKDGKAWW